MVILSIDGMMAVVSLNIKRIVSHMAFSIFTMGVACIVAGKFKKDRQEAREYYNTVVKLPTVFKTQLDQTIMELTNEDLSWLDKVN